MTNLSQRMGIQAPVDVNFPPLLQTQSRFLELRPRLSHFSLRLRKLGPVFNLRQRALPLSTTVRTSHVLGLCTQPRAY